MTYSRIFAINLGAPGITDARAQLVDTIGANVGAPISIGFSDIGSGFYLWYAAAIPVALYGVKFYSAADPTTILAFEAINLPVWSEPVRTLTQSAAQVAAMIEGSTITVRRGDTLSVSLTGLGSLTSYMSLDFTVKNDKHDIDDDAVLQIRKNASGTNDGLMRLNGSGIVTAGDGSITIDNETNGDITIDLLADDALWFAPNNCVYDVQMISAAGVLTLTEGLFIVTGDVKRAVT